MPQGEHDRESVNPGEIKLCPGFHNLFTSKQTTVCSAALRISVPRKKNFPTSSKALRGNVQCGVESFTCCAEAFLSMVQKFSKDSGLLQIMQKRPLGTMPLQNKKTIAAKKQQKT